jgi:hypothetical protein
MSLLILTERERENRLFSSSSARFFLYDLHPIVMAFFYWPIIFFKTTINESKLIEYSVTKEQEKSFGKKVMMSRCVCV